MTALRHTDEYATSAHYSGTGDIRCDDDRRSLTVGATFTLRSEVRLVDGVFDPATPDLAEVYRPAGRCVAVVDATVDRFHGAAMRAYFSAHGIPLTTMVCRALEEDKTVDAVCRMAAFLGGDGCDMARGEPVLVVGGGVLADTAGLACALLNRRTPYVMVGTSIVSAVDAGPSPRTCVNGTLMKNALGAYHPPVLTLVDRGLFRTLAPEHLRHGVAEVVKMAAVDDEQLFTLLQRHGRALLDTRFATTGDDPALAAVADEVLFRSLYAYMRHEGTNMFETRQDRPHAYGHTWSTKFEPVAGLLHGHAVAVEMALTATLATLVGWLDDDDRDALLAVCRDLGLAVHHPVVEDLELMRLAQETVRRKRGGTALWAVAPRGLGRCDYLAEVEGSLLAEAVDRHRARCGAFPDGGLGRDMYLRDARWA
ncbi:3-dehydroquinate synthase family protein [Saccharothrix syringae]|uniref:Iron-containing alcohol dehydrogenase n=1 Tax=Saccharothrix syringae TaxID=103733 RepID=A0A5Q0GWH8_SACSY|nr:iron-containing alcohol dehydrogenase [Saccharothrix syringae]QFZ18339.1 iron-containing alcohol dehydrogenase [Saccharothrix syringae]